MKSVSVLWSRKLVWLGETVLLITMVGAIYGWLILPVATTWHLVLHVLTAIGMLALIALAALMPYRAFGRPRWKGPALLSPVGTGLLIAIGGPYLLIKWVPKMETLNGQAASAALRFLLAAVIFTGALLWLWANTTDEPQ